MNVDMNIVFNLCFMICLFQSVYSGFIGKSERKCVNEIYTVFGFNEKEKYRYRDTIPKLAFQYKHYSMLAEKGRHISQAQHYFMDICNLLRAKDGTMTVRQWCQLNTRIVDCPDDPTETLKNAYINLAEYLFTPEDTAAFDYFNHLLSKLDCIDGKTFMTPTEFCQGRQQASPHIIKTKRKKPDSGHEPGSSSTKHRRNSFPKDLL